MPRRVATGLLYVLATFALTIAFALAHLPTRAGRRAVRDVTNAILASSFRGQLRVAEIQSLDLNGELVATGITLRDPRGVIVFDGGTLVAWPLHLLWRGVRRVPGAPMPSVKLELDRFYLRPDASGLPTIASAFEMRDSQPGSEGTPGRPFVFPAIDVRVRQFVSEMGGIHAEATAVHLTGGTTTAPLALDASLMPTQLTSERTPPIQAGGTFNWRSYIGAPARARPVEDIGDMRGAIDLAGRDLVCHLDFRRLGVETTFRAARCRASEAVVDQIAGQRLGVSIEIASLEATQHAIEPWRITLRGAVNQQAFESTLTVDPNDAVADLTLHGLDLSRVRSELPPSDITGTLHVERHGLGFVVDTTRAQATVAGIQIPPARVRGRLAGSRLLLEDIASEAIGLTAHGEIDLAGADHDATIDARLNEAQIGALPFVENQFRGIATGTIRVVRTRGITTAAFDARGRTLSAPNLRIREARANGQLRLGPADEMVLDADVRGSGLFASDVGPLQVSGHVHGDPRTELQGSIHADGTSMLQKQTAAPAPRRRATPAAPRRAAPAAPRGATTPPRTSAPTRIDATFTARITAGGIHIVIPRSRAVIRGAAGHVTANVNVPRGPRGTVTARARVETDSGGIADLRVDGARVTGSFQRFPLEWLGRAINSPIPLTGQIEGDLGMLTSRTSHTRGTVRWRNGRLPYIGDFDLDVTADHTGDVSQLGAVMTFGTERNTTAVGDRHVIRANVHVVPPRRLDDVTGWIRGLRDADVDGANIPLDLLTPLLPRGTRVAGSGGAHVTVSRTEPDAPLDMVIGVDFRHVQPGAEAADFVPGALRGLVHRNIGMRAATEPLRVRGAICGRVLDPRFARIPISLDTVIAREIAEPVIPPPTACTEAATMTQERLVRTFGSLRGPWHTAALRAWHDYSVAMAAGADSARAVTMSPPTRALLTDSQIDLTVNVGPINSNRWPFMPAVGVAIPALARPALQGVLLASVSAIGNMFSPTLRANADLTTTGVEALVGRDELNVSVNGVIAPLREGESILGQVNLRAHADAHLLARTARGSEPSGTATADLATRLELARLMNPEDGIRSAEIQRFQIDTSRFQIGRLRWARSNNIEGLVTLTLRETGDPVTPIAANATITELRVRTQRSLAASVNGFIRNNEGEWEIQSCLSMLGGQTAPPICDPDAIVETAPEAGLRAGMTLPLAGDLLTFSPNFRGIRLAIAANKFRLEAISPLVEIPPIVRIGGEMSGHAAWTARAPRAINGEVRVIDGMLDLERIGVPARDLVLEVTSNGRRADIARFGFRLGTGTLRAHGNADFNGTGTQVATLTLDAETEQLPLVQEGQIFGYIDSAVNYVGTFSTTGHSGRLRMSRGTVAIPDDTGRDVQALEPDPNIFIIGQTAPPSDSPARPYPIDVDFVTDNPIWLHRADFEMAVRSVGHIHYDPAGVATSGFVEQASRASWFEIFGKRFNFDRLFVQFDGSIVFNPLLDVSAHYDSSSAGRIIVNVTDRFRTPAITFAAEQYPSASQSEILALLVLNRREARGATEQATITSQAQNAAASLLTGLIAGLGTRALRQQFSFLPTVIYQPGEGDLQTGRIGASVAPTSRLYVEGTYGAVQSYYGGSPVVAGQNISRGQEGRLLVEYSISQHLSISATTGTSTRTGVDLFWTP